MSDYLQSHGLQHTKLLCASQSPGVWSNSCPLSRWCFLTISSSAAHFSLCLQSFPVSGSFPMSQLFISGGQSIRASVSASVLPMNNQDWFPLGLAGCISLQSKELSRVFSNTTVWKHQYFSTQNSAVISSVWSNSQTVHDYWRKHSFIAFTIQNFVGKETSLFFNTLSRLVIAFLPRSKCPLVSWLKSLSTVILEPKKIKPVTASTSEKAMATRSSTLAWKIPWTEEPGRLQPMASLSWTRLSDFTFTCHLHALEKEMATHSSVLAWRISGTVEPGGLPSMGSHRIRHDWSDLAAAASTFSLCICHEVTGPWQPIPVFLPEESHGQRSLVGYSPKELDMAEATSHTAWWDQMPRS